MGTKIFAHNARMDGLYHPDLASWGLCSHGQLKGDDTAEIKGRNSCQSALTDDGRLNASIFQVKIRSNSSPYARILILKISSLSGFGSGRRKTFCSG